MIFRFLYEYYVSIPENGRITCCSDIFSQILNALDSYRNEFSMMI